MLLALVSFLAVVPLAAALVLRSLRNGVPRHTPRVPLHKAVALSKALGSGRHHKPFLPEPTEEDEQVGGPGGAGAPMPAALLRNVDVRFISLAGTGKNGRLLLAKAHKAAMRERAVDRRKDRVIKAVQIGKADTAKRMAYGVVYAPGEVDADGDAMEAAEIEKAMHGFMQAGRVGQVDVDHSEEAGAGYVAESWLVKGDASGATLDATFPDAPVGSWAVGIKVTDDAAWQAVEKGEITGLSLGGYGERVPVANDQGRTASGEEDLAKSFVTRVKALLGLEAPSVEHVAPVAKATAADATPVAEESAVPVVPVEAISKGKDNPQPEDVQRLRASLATLDALLAAASATLMKPGARMRPGKDNPEPEDIEKGGLTKGFREKLLHTQLWNVTNALSDTIREVMADESIPDKVAGVRMAVEEFSAWLEGQVSDAVAKAAPAAPVTEAEGPDPLTDVLASIEDLKKAHAEEVAALRDQIEALGDTTAGRQSELGEDAEPIAKGDKPHRGFTFVN